MAKKTDELPPYWRAVAQDEDDEGLFDEDEDEDEA